MSSPHSYSNLRNLPFIAIIVNDSFIFSKKRNHNYKKKEFSCRTEPGFRKCWELLIPLKLDITYEKFTEKMYLKKSSISLFKDDDFQPQRALTSKLKNSEKSRSRRKEKIVRENSDCDMFMTAFEIFENALCQLEIDNDNEQVLEKLIKIEKIIKEKILLINENRNNYENIEFSEKRTSSMISLSSLYSNDFKENVKIDISFAEFLKRVNCPFCSKPYAGTIELIEHLDEDCKPNIKKRFNEKYDLAFSVFQILPNDTFKCNICPSVTLPNLMKYFKHLQTYYHFKAYTKAATLKNYTEFLFCASCKVQVANNHTQINFHMKHKIHKDRKEKTYSSGYFMKRGICCIYVKSKHFKCFECPMNVYKSVGDIMKHFETDKHVKTIEKNVSNLNVLFCEVCSKEMSIFEICKHFKSGDHKDKENKTKEDNYELCFFCGFVCDNLMDLKLHMTSECGVIDTLRKQNPRYETKINNVLKKNKVADKSNVDGGNIIVKDFQEIPELFSYFESFGQISSLEMYEDKHVMVKFKEKSTAASILLFKDNLSINGVKLKITTDDKLLNFRSGMNVSKKMMILSESENSQSSFDNSESDKDAMENEDISSIRVLQRDQLPSLFQRVTSHLLNISQKLGSTAEVKSILGCSKTFTGEDCNLVGFSGCGLSLPTESISLYCPMRIDSLNIFLTGSISVNDTGLNSIIFLSKLRKKMCASELWKNVINSVNSFPHIKCQHKETEKMCTITCAKSAMLLTEMLRDCLEENDLVRSFCVLIRFWLGVQKLKIRKFEYVVISLIIFFLIIKNVVKLSESKYLKEKDFSLEIISQDNLDLKENSSGKKNNEAFDLQRLFYEFLKFLNTFNFDKFAICLPLPYPVPKVTIFKRLKAITSDSDEIPKSSMYITECNFVHNLAFYVSEKHLKSLLKTVKSSLKNY